MTDSEKLDLLLNKMSHVEERLDNVERRLDSMDSRLDSMDGRLKHVEEDTSSIKLVLENEIRVNIQRVAEGHLELSRNLHDAMLPSSEMEMLAIKVRMLESDMKEVKRKVALA